MEKKKLTTLLFELDRILGTPTEKTWPGVAQLPDYKPNFPRWSGEGLRKAVPQLDNNGLDLLEVHCILVVISVQGDISSLHVEHA